VTYHIETLLIVDVHSTGYRSECNHPVVVTTFPNVGLWCFYVACITRELRLLRVVCNTVHNFSGRHSVCDYSCRLVYTGYYNKFV